ncbi:MAG: hypothetical protein JNM31_00655 [Flavobacteriales bacterium]|nr:hypothetical protein [Flavobacteriales bacterium]
MTMQHQHRILALLLPALILLGCMNDESTPQQPAEPTAPVVSERGPETGPLSDSGLRFDGVYISREGNIFYLLRFFPQGNVTVINGPDSTNGDFLRKMIAKQGLEPNPVIGLYNVPVERCDDSLHFSTKAMRGLIEYDGRMHGPDSLHFLKYSHINGRKAMYAYGFSPDAQQ